MTFGTVTNFDEHATVRFERELAASIESVWRALTDPAALAAWLAPTEFDATVGGLVRIDFGEDQKVAGAITLIEPPHRLEYTWTFTDEPDSVLRFELEESDGGTKLVLEHRLLPSEQAAGYGAGWHAHLDVLAGFLAGEEPVDWEKTFNAVLGSYAGA